MNVWKAWDIFSVDDDKIKIYNKIPTNMYPVLVKDSWKNYQRREIETLTYNPNEDTLTLLLKEENTEEN